MQALVVEKNDHQVSPKSTVATMSGNSQIVLLCTTSSSCDDSSKTTTHARDTRVATPTASLTRDGNR